MKIEYPHSLTGEETYNRINDLLPALQKQYSDQISNLQTKWDEDLTQMDFSMALIGFKIGGKAYLKDYQVTLEGKLPFMVKMFRSQIENMILKELDCLFS